MKLQLFVGTKPKGLQNLTQNVLKREIRKHESLKVGNKQQTNDQCRKTGTQQKGSTVLQEQDQASYSNCLHL